MNRCSKGSRMNVRRQSFSFYRSRPILSLYSAVLPRERWRGSGEIVIGQLRPQTANQSSYVPRYYDEPYLAFGYYHIIST